MHTMTIADMVTLLENVALGMQEPVMVWGPPGAGKSEAIAQLVLQSRWQRVKGLLKRLTGDKGEFGQLVDVRLSQYDSVDLRGIPVPESETGLTVWHAPSTLPFKGNPRFDESVPLIVLFLDELPNASLSVQAAGYQLVNDRRVGEHELMDNVIVIAAGNRDGDKGATHRMPMPLANRFTHVEVMPDVDTWTTWAQSAGLPPVGIAFLHFRKQLLMTFDPAKPAKAFATPRTWAKALRYYNATMPEPTKMAAISGAVGEGPAAEFWAFVDVWQSMTPIKDILANPTKVKVPEELSMRYATTIAVSGAMNAETVGAAHAFLTRLDPEFVVLAWTLATKRDSTLFSTNEFLAFAKQYKAVFMP